MQRFLQVCALTYMYMYSRIIYKFLPWFPLLMLIVGNILLVSLVVGGCNDDELHAGKMLP